MSTHEVSNQTPPMSGHNLYQADVVLAEAVARAGGGWAETELRQFGLLVGSEELAEHGRLANENRPTLRAYDRFGHRVNEVVYHPSYHHLMRTSIEAGLHSLSWTNPRPGALAVRAAKNFLMTQVEAGHGCPITMTFAAVAALRHNPTIEATWRDKLIARQYDPSNAPITTKAGCTMGMAMTEKQGGSDVRANTTRATEEADGTYRLTGHKWFCSAPMSDAFFTLAYIDDALTCFFVPRWTPDGTPNRMNLQRLKDKLGDRSNASSEVEYDEAWAQCVGEPGRGVPTIIDMVTHTRLDCVVASTALMRQGLSRAIHHARHRKVFGKRLIDQPLMRNVLADVALEIEGATALAFRLVESFEKAAGTPSEAAFSRLATAIGKYYICKRSPGVVYETMECLGGNGYIEEHDMARLYRQAPLNSIWEGSGNVICLDVLRALGRSPAGLNALRLELEAAKGAHPAFDRALHKLFEMLAKPQELEINARHVVEKMALCLQAALLVRSSDGPIAEAFITSRLGSGCTYTMGTLPQGAPVDTLIARAWTPELA